MRKLILLLALVGMFTGLNAQVYSTNTGLVSFFSSTPVEDISAKNQKVLAALNAKGELAVIITNTAFEFENKLMQEHFNEKYMESEKYPQSTFKGKIDQQIDFSKDGEYPVTATGKLTIHGVTIDRTISGKLIVKNGTVRLLSTFKVRTADHSIKIPTLVIAKIAEEIEVKVDLNLVPKK